MNREAPTLGQKTRERPIFDGTDRVRIKTTVGQGRDVRVSENLDMRVRMRFPQCLQRRATSG